VSAPTTWTIPEVRAALDARKTSARELVKEFYAQIDKRNADASKQSRPLLGIPIVLNMKPSSAPQSWEGDVYNAEDGKTYSGSFTLTGANTAQLKGCVLGGLICKAQTWTRSN